MYVAINLFTSGTRLLQNLCDVGGAEMNVMGEEMGSSVDVRIIRQNALVGETQPCPDICRGQCGSDFHPLFFGRELK